MSGLGTMISRATLSPKSKTLLRYSRSSGSSTPEAVEEEIMILSSSSEWASISSPSRMPQGRKTKLVEALTSHTTGLKQEHEELEGAADPERDPLGLLDGEVLGRLLPEDQVRVGYDPEPEDDRDHRDDPLARYPYSAAGPAR